MPLARATSQMSFGNASIDARSERARLNTSKAIGEVFNIATGTPYSTNQVVLRLQQRLGKKHLKRVHKPPRKGEIMHSYASIKKAARILGYTPKFPLRTGITKLVRSYLKSARVSK